MGRDVLHIDARCCHLIYWFDLERRTFSLVWTSHWGKGWLVNQVSWWSMTPETKTMCQIPKLFDLFRSSLGSVLDHFGHIFAAPTWRGHHRSIVHREYLHVGKGRDLGFNSVPRGIVGMVGSHEFTSQMIIMIGLSGHCAHCISNILVTSNGALQMMATCRCCSSSPSCHRAQVNNCSLDKCSASATRWPLALLTYEMLRQTEVLFGKAGQFIKLLCLCLNKLTPFDWYWVWTMDEKRYQ